MDLDGLHIKAVSRGGLNTCIAIPSYKMAFDIGCCPDFAVPMKRILFTHPHIDHMGGVLHHAARRKMFGMSTPEYIMERCHVANFERMMDAWRTLSESELPCTVRGVAPGESFELGKLQIEPFRALHRVPTIGYCIWSNKNKLLPELVGTPGPQLARMRQQGKTITHPVRTAEIAFCGDTQAAVLDEPAVQAAQRLVLECTFVEGDVQLANKTMHVHLDELAKRQHQLQHKAILLTHFSQRTPTSVIRARVDAALRPDTRARLRLLPECEDATA